MALDLGMRVVGYDPAISVEAAWRLSSRVEKMSSLDALLKESDYITLHVPAIDVTKGMINSESIVPHEAWREAPELFPKGDSER